MYQVKFIFNHIYKHGNVQTVNRNFFADILYTGKSKAYLCALCANMCEMNRNAAVYQN